MIKRYISIIFIGLILLPNIYLYSINLNIRSLILTIFSLFYLGSFFKNSRWIGFLIPLYMLLPVVLGYIYYYKIMPEEQVFSIILETNWQEASNYIGTMINYYIFLISIWIFSCFYFLYINTGFPLRWTHRSRYWVLIAGTIGLVVTLLSEYNFKNEAIKDFELNDTFLAETKANINSELEQIYPFGIFINLYDMYYEQNKINSAFERNSSFNFNAKSMEKNDKEQIVILVIGETSRRNNWQLNGYNRKTNPLLSQQSNLVNLTDIISVSSVTRTSVPIILTRKPAELVNKFEFNEKSIITAFKEAGFYTYWISTQQKFGSYDTSTSVYAKEADVMMFLNRTNYSYRGDTDAVVLPIVKKILNKKNKKIFIVLHTLGSHYNYSHRYPAEFNYFNPSLSNLKKYSLQNRKYKQQLINSYDNSILYTDYVLNDLIEIIKSKSETESFLFYSSDHGEDLFDGKCNKTGHGNDTAYNFEIASFIWYSNEFENNNFSKVKNVKNNANKKINHTSVFPTLIDAAGIKIPNYQKEKSLLNNLHYYPRIVMGSHNYDKTSYDNICREIK